MSDTKTLFPDVEEFVGFKTKTRAERKYESSNSSNSKVETLINEWNDNVVPILTGVKCNSLDEFAMQVANVAGQCIKYKSAEAMQQQPVQSQQNQMFVDVNTLIKENNYLKSLNASKDEEIKALRERLVALGQPV